MSASGERRKARELAQVHKALDSLDPPAPVGVGWPADTSYDAYVTALYEALGRAEMLMVIFGPEGPQPINTPGERERRILMHSFYPDYQFGETQ